MKAMAEDLETGEKVTVDISGEYYEELQLLAQDKVSDSKLQSYIDNLDLSADAKALISSFLKTAVKVGELIIKVGKRIVEIVVMITTKYPNATFGLVLGLLVGMLIAAIPILGVVLGAVAKPIAAVFGLATGYIEDLKDQNLTRKIAEAAAMFQPLDGEVHVAS